jgi:legumain
MRPLLSFLLILLATTCHAHGDKWAVLVSGSRGFENYRHQADVCHSYHVLRDRGFNPNRIILFTYDDVPYAEDNPYKGQLFNRPGLDSIDYNEGCVKDYTGDEVTPQNFINVLTGNSTAMKDIGSGRVLRSNQHDKVFIYFSDHGGPGLIAFPFEELYANQLIETFQIMHESDMYKKLVFYLEACESGSMFEGLLDPSLNILAVTASNSTQSSYAAYCPPNDIVNGVHIGTCLGDEFSVNWMEDSDRMIPYETLEEQINTVAELTINSEVSTFGDFGFVDKYLGSFIGHPVHDGWHGFFPERHFDVLNVRNGRIDYLYRKYIGESSWTNAEKLQNEIDRREVITDIFIEFEEMVDQKRNITLCEDKLKPRNFACLEAGVNAYKNYCGLLDIYSYQFVQEIVNACETGVEICDIENAFKDICRREEIKEGLIDNTGEDVLHSPDFIIPEEAPFHSPDFNITQDSILPIEIPFHSKDFNPEEAPLVTPDLNNPEEASFHSPDLSLDEGLLDSTDSNNGEFLPNSPDYTTQDDQSNLQALIVIERSNLRGSRNMRFRSSS